MKIQSQHYRTIWSSTHSHDVFIIDQTRLPFEFDIVCIQSLHAMVHAIKTMQVRGAPLIGASAAYGMALAVKEDPSDQAMQHAAQVLVASRPTAVNLRWAVERMLHVLNGVSVSDRVSLAWQEAAKLCDEDVAMNHALGAHGAQLIRELHTRLAKASPSEARTVNILTHCNAGWLAAVDWGTALAPIYQAHDAGIPVHVWVDETRPRNQGASLTAWELGQHGVPNTVIADNAGGHLMQHGQVDMVIVGADRVTATGDVCNKIGTYLKALAAMDNQVPFYAAVPSPTIDWRMDDGIAQIEIENRNEDEVAYISGLGRDGQPSMVRVIPEGSRALNPAFDVTPARFVTGIITERGVCAPNALKSLGYTD